MIPPVRCFSCGKPIGSKWEDYQKLLEEGKSMKEALDEVGLERFCCRGAIMSHVESIDIVSEYR
jgi:DNA-directed RNA polymerase subunit N (RpoN/RPB10)